ncbi:hypothetical protein AcW2_006361 [Taiwanofungus camphoratus]|nr:hypothetical protein AcW2_006361 [Antrodia cinnamomea]
MRAHRLLPLLPLLPALATAAAAAALVAAAPPTHALREAPPVSHEYMLITRDGDHDHHGGHHVQPVYDLNETEVTMFHAPTPPSYWTIDLVDRVPDQHRYPGLMVVHVLFMGLAFFGALPIGIALRSVKHAWHGFSVILFYVFSALGLGASMLYKKLTPDMYEGARHGSQGWGWLFFAALLSVVDLAAIAMRFVRYIRALRTGEERFGIKAAWRTVVLARDDHLGAAAEYTGLVADDAEEIMDEVELKVKDTDSDASLHVRRDVPMEPIRTLFDADAHEDEVDAHAGTAEWANNVDRHRHQHRREPSYPQSAASERTLFNPPSPRHSNDTLPEYIGHIAWIARGTSKTPLLKRLGRVVFAIAERVLVFAGFMQVLTGVVVYTGGCRENYINGCLAHLIKGGIFWCYGLVTFARYLGSFSEIGWAWNVAPSGSYPSAEFVESAVIFLYGITNTWMERFGAHPGDPYTTKQMQHISIAIMFWFAGLVGMGIESKRVRRWLAAGSTAAVPAARRSREAVAEPPSYRGSFNPFPAMCIGVTGAAMSAHFQTYVFQVQIHTLWGYLLSGFAVLRCLTYFFVWLAPPRSILPSRPPTEALASFFLTCGGLMFMSSTEELTIAAMRQGHDDVMMFANVGIAVTCFAFCWTLGVVGFKGWLKSRTHAAVQFHGSA